MIPILEKNAQKKKFFGCLERKGILVFPQLKRLRALQAHPQCVRSEATGSASEIAQEPLLEKSPVLLVKMPQVVSGCLIPKKDSILGSGKRTAWNSKWCFTPKLKTDRIRKPNSQPNSATLHLVTQ